MNLRVILLIGLAAAFCAQAQIPNRSDPHLQRVDRELAAILQWKILWKDTPKGFRYPPGGSAAVALYMTSNALLYCSHDLGVCAEYRISTVRNWESLSEARLGDGQSDHDALLSYAASLGKRVPAPAPPTNQIGPGGFAGFPAPDSPLIWTTRLKLSTRAEIVRRYRRLHPAQLRSLRTWLRTTLHGYRSATVACFEPTDPVVYIYGDRINRRPIVFSVFWNGESNTWEQAGMTAGRGEQVQIESLKRIIESISCGTVTF